MDIYVQSRGFAQDDDYCWQRETPPIIKKHKVNSLIQSESPSVVIARYGGKLLLLVTGLQANERVDFIGRTIRNSVAWISQEPDDEAKFRAIAVRALNGSLSKDIDKLIVFGGEYGFKFEEEEIKNLDFLDEIGIEYVEPDNEKKIAKNSQNLRIELANELKKYRLPTMENAVLVVVTGIKSASTLMQTKVWRGLSNIVQEEQWSAYIKSPSLNETEKISNQVENDHKIWLYLFMSISTIAALAIILCLLLPQSQPKQETQLIPQNSSEPVQTVQSSLTVNQLQENQVVDNKQSSDTENIDPQDNVKSDVEGK